jgi:hypothetical protein
MNKDEQAELAKDIADFITRHGDTCLAMCRKTVDERSCAMSAHIHFMVRGQPINEETARILGKALVLWHRYKTENRP